MKEIAYKPSTEEQEYLIKKAGCYRYIYNSCLANNGENVDLSEADFIPEVMTDEDIDMVLEDFYVDLECGESMDFIRKKHSSVVVAGGSDYLSEHQDASGSGEQCYFVKVTSSHNKQPEFALLW